jgi:hypothetical protein
MIGLGKGELSGVEIPGLGRRCEWSVMEQDRPVRYLLVRR